MPPGPPFAALIRQLAPDSETVPDDELLDRFARSRDQSAFELLVWRHGAMVWGVCRRILAPDRDAAEDACQAAFVALASHAGHVRHRQALPAWLHRVAVRAALDVLATRRVTQLLSNDLPDLVDQQPGPDEIAADREVQSLLDAGLNRLPEMLRIPFVMCELEGRSNAEAAATLGCPIGTVESRLTRARRRLRGWLTARGVTPTALGAASTVPDTVRAAMIRAGTLRDAIRPAVRAIADRAVRSALGAKLGATVVLAMVLAATVAGFGLPAGGLPEPPGPSNPLPQPTDKTKPLAAGRVDAEGVPLPPGAVARLGSSRLRHGGAVVDVAFSPDRTRIASCGADQTIRVWDGTTGRQVCLTRWTEGRVLDVRFTADGKTLIAAGSDEQKPPAVWHIDPTTGAVLTRRTWSLAPGWVDYNLSPDGSRIAVCETDTKTVRVFDTTSGRELWRAGLGEGDGRSPAFALDGRTLAVASINRIYLFDSAGKPGGQLVLDVDPEACLTSVVLSPDGQRVAAYWTFRKGRLEVWNRATGRVTWSRQFEHPFPNYTQAFSPDGKWLVQTGFTSEGQRAATVVDAADGKDKTVIALWDIPGCARFRSDGMLTVGGQWGPIRLYDPANGKPLAPVPDPPDGVQLQGFSADGRTLFGWSEGWYAWDVATGQQRRLAIEGNGNEAISPDGTRMARFAGEKDTARLEILDAKTGKIIHAHRGPEFGDVGVGFRFTPDGKGVIGALWEDGTTRVWAVDTGKELIRIAKESGQPGADATSADGRVYVAVDYQNQDGGRPIRVIRVWDLKTGRELAKFSPVELATNSVAVSADGRRVAATVIAEQTQPDPQVTVWDVASKKVLVRLPQRGRAGAAEFSPDGRTFAVAVWQPWDSIWVVRVYEVASGSERLAFQHDGRVIGFTFSPNGKLLAASSAEAPVYLWDLTGDTGGPATWNPGDANKVWEDLSSGDAARAFTAIRRLRANPTPALAFLKDRVKPPRAPDADALKGLFADLAAEDFEVREKTGEILAGYDEAVRPAMVRELSQSQSPEARIRLQKLIARLDGPTPIRLRLIRVVEAVEGMGTAEADRLLAKWASEPAGSTLATEATAALARRRK